MFFVSFTYIRLKGALHEILLGLLRFEQATRTVVRINAVDERCSEPTVGLALRHHNHAAHRAAAGHEPRPRARPSKDQQCILSYIDVVHSNVI